MSLSVQDIQKLYIAILGRPADVQGLEALAVQSLDQAAETLVASNEYDQTYGFLSLSEQISAAYDRLFGRSAKVSEIVYWQEQIETLELDIHEVITAIDTSKDPDKAAFDAKLAAALGFNAALDTNLEKTGYRGSSPFDLAREWLASIQDQGDAQYQLSSPVLHDAILTIIGAKKSINLSSDAATVVEGEVASFTLSAVNFPTGAEFPYTITGVSGSDIEGGRLSGIARLGLDGRVDIPIRIKIDDLAEGAETLTLTVGSASASISVIDPVETHVNTDNTAPVLRSDIVKYVREDRPVDQAILRLTAKDKENDELKFFIADDLHDEAFFYIDESTGDLFLKRPLSFSTPEDENSDNKYVLHFMVTDGALESYGSAKIIIQNQNENEVRAGIVARGEKRFLFGSFEPGTLIEIVFGDTLIETIVVTESGILEYQIPQELVQTEQDVLVRAHQQSGGRQDIVLNPAPLENGHGGSVGNDILFGGDGAVLFGGSGDDKLFGFSSDTIADYAGASQNYTIVIESDRVIVFDRSGQEGTDDLFNISRIGFSDKVIDISDYSSLHDLTSKDIASLIHLYIACFNRAPDVHGLSFWAARYAEGARLEAIAKEFYNAPEFRDLYGENLPADAFVERVYENVLGRSPDPGGLRFWTEQLDAENLRPENFLIAFIKSALDQCDPNDAQFIINRSMVAAEFSLKAGLSDEGLAHELMLLVDEDMETVEEALSLIASLNDQAVNDPAELLIQFVGII